MAIQDLGVSLEVDVNRPASPADDWRKLKRPLSVVQRFEFGYVARSRSQCLNASHHPQFPATLANPANTKVALPKQQPVVRKSGVMKTGQKGVGDGRGFSTDIRALAPGQRQANGIVIQVVVTDKVQQATGVSAFAQGQSPRQYTERDVT